MSRFTFWFALVVGAAFARGADVSLASARRAQALLGPGVWSQVIRVENEARASRYPHELHALVFELAGILWFYTDADGTQSLSLQRGRLAEDKADFAPLLRSIEPGFRRWSVAPEGEATPGGLPNGCFIESVAALRLRLARGEPATEARLLSYYFETPAGRRGHTVLSYRTDRGREVIDPERSARPRLFSAEEADDALHLAQALEFQTVAKARWVPVELPAAHAGIFAGGGGAGLDEFAGALAWAL